MKMLDYTELQNGKMMIKVQRELYPLKVIYRSCYKFLDDFYLGLDQDDIYYIIYISRKEGSIQKMDIGEFQNELLDQCLRNEISEKTKNVRELVVTRALYSAFIPKSEIPQEIEEDDGNLDLIAKAWYDNDSEVE